MVFDHFQRNSTVIFSQNLKVQEVFVIHGFDVREFLIQESLESFISLHFAAQSCNSRIFNLLKFVSELDKSHLISLSMSF